MDWSSKLKESHPQKYALKIMCRSIYFMGIGDCWYERSKRSRTHKILYAAWATIMNSYIILNTLNELLAHVRSDLTVKEKKDLIQFSFAHPSLCLKYIFLVFQKDRVRVLFKKLVDGSRNIFTSLEIEKKSVKESIRYFVGLALICYGTLVLTAVDAMTALRKEGTPYRTEVTLFPSSYYTGIFAPFLRVIIEMHWWCIVTNMILVDGLSFFSLVFLKYKFRLVRMYFESLGKKSVKNLDVKTARKCVDEFKEDFITGIKLHEDALWCARNVQYALGNIYGVQIIETSTLLVMCLVKLVASSSERNMTFMLANLGYIGCMIILNGAYMMAAGDVTHEASKISTAIFHCGWELLKNGRGFHTLAVVAIARSQVPVYMTAFGVITLSYVNFITVIRSSYSFFAVMY